MLVITRKLGEGLMISDDIKITVIEVGKDRVRIGIDAPKEVRIVRDELYITEKENLEASSALPKEVMEQLFKNKE